MRPRAKLALGTLLALTISAGAFPAPISESITVLTAQNIIEVGLDSKDPTVRVLAIRATGMIAKSESVRKRLEGLLRDKNPSVRITATESLADLDFHQSIPILLNLLKNDPVPEVQFAAAKALYKLKAPDGKETLEDILDQRIKASSSALQKEKRHFLANFYSVHSTTAFLLDQGGGFVPLPGVGMGLGEVAHLMNDASLSPRANVILILGRDKSADIDQLLRDSLHDTDWTVRASAALMIALTARKNLRDDLIPLLSDREQRVRFRAAGAYLHLVGAPAPKEESPKEEFSKEELPKPK